MAPSRVNIYFRIFCWRLLTVRGFAPVRFLFCGKCRTFKGKISVQDFDWDFGGMFFWERGWGRSNIWRKKSLILIFFEGWCRRASNGFRSKITVGPNVRHFSNMNVAIAAWRRNVAKVARRFNVSGGFIENMRRKAYNKKHAAETRGKKRVDWVVGWGGEDAPARLRQRSVQL